jgi:tRNA modification GTPase
MILNNNEVVTDEELDLLAKIKNKNHIIVINKTDLENKLNLYVDNAIKISVKDNEGIEDIKNRIVEIFNLDKISTSDLPYLSSARSISLLKESLNKIKECINNIKNEVPIDIIELDLKECWNILGLIIGETYTDELIDEMFSRFCLGK